MKVNQTHTQVQNKATTMLATANTAEAIISMRVYT